MPELMTTLEAIHKIEDSKRKFQASLAGMNVEESEKEVRFEDVKRRALGITTGADDVVSLQGEYAVQAGFGIGNGLGYRSV